MKKLFLILGAAVVVGGVAIAVGFAIARQRAGQVLRTHLVAELRNRFNSDVTLESLDVEVYPHLEATGENLVIRRRGHPDEPPFIKVKRFFVYATASGLLHRPYQIQSARLEGLEITVPPHQKGAAEPPPTSLAPPAPIAPNPAVKVPTKKGLPPFDIARINADGAVLTLIPADPNKEPHEFDISHLHMRSVGIDRPMAFDATLANPMPPGEIKSTGSFGPWDEDDPGETPVEGKYTFRDADLSAFHGMRGTLSSDGDYSGVLERILVSGATDTPDFAITISNHPIHLATRFTAIVDGTSGDTFLHPVSAQFRRSSVVVSGAIEGVPGRHGKTIKLDATVVDARLEDLLYLAVNSSKPPMTGNISFRSKVDIPPGPRTIGEKLFLQGQFGVAAANFTDEAVKEKLADLSHKASGHPKEEDTESVLSDLKGRFELKDAVVTFTNLLFDVPGAEINLDGTYGMQSEQLDFHGTMKMKAKLSQTTTGVKSFFLKAVDPFFSKNGAGTFLHIQITGTRDNPQFGLDKRKRDAKEKESDKPKNGAASEKSR